MNNNLNKLNKLDVLNKLVGRERIRPKRDRVRLILPFSNTENDLWLDPETTTAGAQTKACEACGQVLPGAVVLALHSSFHL